MHAHSGGLHIDVFCSNNIPCFAPNTRSTPILTVVILLCCEKGCPGSPLLGLLLMGSTDDWVCLPDPSTGASYYANLVTGETTWERPVCLDDGSCSATADTGCATTAAGPSSEGEAAVAALGASTAHPANQRRDERRRSVPKPRKASVAGATKWIEYMDEEQGIPYYYNEGTGESVWVIPADDDDDYDLDEEGYDEILADEAAEKRQKRIERRQRILKEILTTERSYVAALQVCKKVYLDPLRVVAEVPQCAIFTHNDLDAIFLNIDLISKVRVCPGTAPLRPPSGRLCPAPHAPARARARRPPGLAEGPCPSPPQTGTGERQVSRRSRGRMGGERPRGALRGYLQAGRAAVQGLLHAIRQQLRLVGGEAEKDPRVVRCWGPREAALPDEADLQPGRQRQRCHLVPDPARATCAPIPPAAD